jgi:3-hydroxyisobutyrate dehydrogenase-like beta-hydroxyacid dehydrogenase
LLRAVRNSRGKTAVEAGYLGVGAMGQPMAHKRLDAGHGLTIYDINEAAVRPLLERQARRANSPRELLSSLISYRVFESTFH